MSLINQMLRDLEKRNPANPPTQQPLMIQKVEHQSKMHLRSAAWFAALLVILVLLWLKNSHNEPIQLATSASPIPPQSLNITPVIAEQPHSPAVIQVAEPEIVTIPSQEKPAVPIQAPPLKLNRTLPSYEQKKPDRAAPIEAKSSALQPKTDLKIIRSDTNRKSVNTRQRAEVLYQQAGASASRMMRKEFLREALEFNPRHLGARNMLVQTLQQEKSGIELKQFLDESLELFPGNPGFTTALAYWHIKQKNAGAAINALESIDHVQNHDPKYLALKAAGYQQQQNFSQALPLYQELTQIQPEKAENWLGLGVSADRLHQSGTAVQAYQKALNKKTLHNDVVDYINQRLSALTP